MKYILILGLFLGTLWAWDLERTTEKGHRVAQENLEELCQVFPFVCNK